MVTEVIKSRYQTNNPSFKIDKPAKNACKPGQKDGNMKLKKSFFH